MVRFKYGMLLLLGKLTGWLPLRVRFALGTGLYGLLYHVVKYRRAVVRKNLTESFPDKGTGEIAAIERRFYRTLADLFIDTMAIASMREKEIRARMDFPHAADFEAALPAASMLSLMGHVGSWELTSGYPLFSDKNVLAVYHPLQSKASDRYFCHVRSRFGSHPVPMKGVTRAVADSIRKNEPIAVALIADQNPTSKGAMGWFPFLGRDTAFFTGAERIALKYHLPVALLRIKETRRGYYQARHELIYDPSEQVPDGEITRRYVAALEEMIVESPHLWLWSHKRWKLKKKPQQ